MKRLYVGKLNNYNKVFFLSHINNSFLNSLKYFMKMDTNGKKMVCN